MRSTQNHTHFLPLAICLFLALCIQACAKETAAFDPESTLAQLEIELPIPSESIANYVGAVRSGNLVFLSGHLPRQSDGSLVTGKLGDSVSEEEGYQAARLATIGLLATLKSEIGDLAKVKRIVKVTGMVNATGDFTRHSQVINGCSDLLGNVFGERGRHARAASGFSSLPLDSAVEIEMIVEVQ